MAKYGFDYFLKRGNVINEMARPFSVFTSIDPELAPLQNAYINLMSKVAPFVGKDSAKRQFFVYDYLLSSLMDIIEPDLDMDVGAYASEITGMSRGFNTMKAAFLKKAQEHKDIVTSPEFLEKVVDDANIDQHKNLVATRGGNRKKGYNREVVDTLGVSADDFRTVSQQAEPIVTALNRIMGSRKSNLTKKGQPEVAAAAPQQGGSPDLDFAYSVVDAIDSLLESRIDYLAELKRDPSILDEIDDNTKVLLSDAARELIETVKGMYTEMINSGTGVSPEEFTQQIQNMSQAMTDAGKSKKAMLYDMIANEVEELTNFSADMRGLQDSIGTNEKRYPGYDTDVLAKIVDTPEKQELFDKWFDMHTQWRKNKNEKLEQLWIRKLMQLNFFDRKGIEDDGRNYMDADVQALLSQQRRYFEMLQKEENPDRQAALQKKVMDITKQIKMKRGEYVPEAPKDEAPQPEEQEESGVMGYMTEQVSKDRHLGKPTGKFVDRGFKKFVNYNHWLEVNS